VPQGSYRSGTINKEIKNPFALSLSKGFDKLSPNGVH